MIQYVQDDAFNHIGEHDIMLVGTNLYNSMANGFQLDVSLNYPYVFEANLSTKYGDMNKLGTIMECSKDGEQTFLLCFITVGYNFRPDLKKDYLNYEALQKCLELVNAKYPKANIGTPFLGTSRFDGLGQRDKVAEIFDKTLTDVKCTIYDYKQLSRKEKLKEMYMAEQAVKKTDREAYYRMVNARKAQAEERFKLNGRRRY